MKSEGAGARITFLGAAGTVTGSRHLLEVQDSYYLIDCGLFQGGSKLKERNWKPFPVSLDRLEAIFLTHAHIDHTGYVPALVAQGFSGPIYATEATCELLKVLLRDSAYLQEQEAAYANKRGYTNHHPALPLYTVDDAEKALQLLRPVTYEEPLELDYLKVQWTPAGHLLGSAIVEITIESGTGKRKLVFSGDLGRYTSDIMKPPQSVSTADVLVIESTYGDRLHEDESVDDCLTQIIQKIVSTQGVLLIPSFAVGRTQQILYRVRRLQDRGLVPAVPVFIDSPMATSSTHIYCRFGDEHNLSVDLLMDDKVCPLNCPETRFVKDVQESKELNQMPGPAIVISASGMCTGGRILHHLKWRLPHKKNSVLFVGYQGQGTTGRRLVDGAKEISIHGERIAVNADIVTVSALSGHADQGEIMRWLSGFESAPKTTFIVHGEPESSLGLKGKIEETLDWNVVVPKNGDRVEI